MEPVKVKVSGCAPVLVSGCAPVLPPLERLVPDEVWRLSGLKKRVLSIAGWLLLVSVGTGYGCGCGCGCGCMCLGGLGALRGDVNILGAPSPLLAGAGAGAAETETARTARA